MPPQAWLILPVLLLVAIPHELAHLVMARHFGVTVLEFGLGLPPRAVSREWRGIRWSLNWLLPFGAFVTLKGEHGGTERDDFAALPPRQRAIVLAAGPIANLVVAAVAIVLVLNLFGVPDGARSVVVRERVALLGWVGLLQVMEELATVQIPMAQWFLALLGSLSLGLGLTNLAPVPPLDGGRIFAGGVEGVTGWRPLSRAWALRMNMMGYALLVVVFLAVTAADLVRLVSGRLIVSSG